MEGAVVMGKAVKPIKDIKTELRLIKKFKDEDIRVYNYWVIARPGAFRSKDVLPLTVGDIKRMLEKGYFDINESKTDKNRCLPFDSATRSELIDMIKNKRSKDVLFPSRKGINQPLTHRQMQRLILRYGKECCIKNIGTHTPRKTTAYHLYIETGGDILEVKKLLGHDNKRDTYKYVDIEQESKLYRIKKINNPFSNKNKHLNIYE